MYNELNALGNTQIGTGVDFGMEELRALKEEYNQILSDIRIRPNHIYMYDLEAINKELYIKTVQYITGCTTIEVFELLPEKVLKQIHMYLKGIIYRYKNK